MASSAVGVLTVHRRINYIADHLNKDLSIPTEAVFHQKHHIRDIRHSTIRMLRQETPDLSYNNETISKKQLTIE